MSVRKTIGRELSQYVKASLAANDLQAIIAHLLYVKHHWEDLSDILPAMTMPCLLYAGKSDEEYLNIKKCARAHKTYLLLFTYDFHPPLYGKVKKRKLFMFFSNYFQH